jgi:hypothetical protein
LAQVCTKTSATSRRSMNRTNFAMADRSQMLTPPAYRALSPAGRKVLAAIEREVERCSGVVTVSLLTSGSCGVSKSASPMAEAGRVAWFGQRRAAGPRQRLMNIFRLDAGSPDADTAAAAVAGTARSDSPRRSGQAQRQTPSLPKLSGRCAVTTGVTQ